MKFIYLIIYTYTIFTTSPVSAELTAFEQNGKWGYQNEQAQVTIPPQFIMANDFDQGVASVIDEQGWAFINTQGKVIIRPFIFDNGPDYFIEGLSRFVQHGKIGFINEKYEIIIPAQFDFVRPFNKGMAAFCTGCQTVKFDDEHSIIRGGTWGYINKEGHILIDQIASEMALDEISNSQAFSKK